MQNIAVRAARSPAGYVLAYGSAVVAVAIVLAVYPLIGIPGSQISFILLLAAVAFSAWYGGLGAGLLATVLSVLAAVYFLVPPALTFEIPDPATRARLLIFILASLFVNGLSYARARAESRTAAERSRLQVTLASIADAVIATDTQGHITFMNPVAESITGCNLQEALGKDLAHVFRIVDEQTHKPAENPVDMVLRIRATASPNNHTALLAKDGTEHPIEISVAPLRSGSGDISGVVLAFRDIGEHRKRDSELEQLLSDMRHERVRLRDIVANVPGVVWEARGEPDVASQQITFVSEYAEKMLGYSVEDWTTIPNFWLKIVHPDDKEVAARTAAENFLKPAAGVNRFRWMTKQGRAVWVESYSTAIRDGNGTPVGMRGVAMDISEQKRLEDQVRNHAERLQLEYERLASLIDQINIGLMLIDKDGRYVLANDKWLEQTGYERRDVLGRHYREFTTGSKGAMAGAMLQEALDTGEPVTLHEFSLEDAARPEGRYVDWSILPIRDADGTITGVLNALFDVTEKVRTRQEIEEQRSTLRTIVEGTPVGLALIDKEMRIVDLNAEWAKTAGIDLHTAEGRIVYSIDDGFAQRRVHYERVLTGEPVDLENVPFTDPVDKAMKYRDIHLRPVRDSNGAITGMLNAVVDVTARHLLDRQKDEFIAMASHELKTPITTIKGYTQLSLRSARKMGDEALVRALTVVDERANRLTRLINEMLDVSRIQSGSLPLEQECFDLGRMVREVVAGTELISPGFHFELDLPDEEFTVNADYQRIEQVVTNLVQNAIKYSNNSGRATVSIKSDGERATVCVRDYGVGIPLSQQGEVFKRFFRASNVAYTNYSGLGLGLFISYGIIERHGGHMRVESQEGKGSAFYFDLPLCNEKIGEEV